MGSNYTSINLVLTILIHFKQCSLNSEIKKTKRDLVINLKQDTNDENGKIQFYSKRRNLRFIFLFKEKNT